MIKRITLVFMCILLSACANLNGNNDFDSVFNKNNQETVRANNYAEYIEYYLPSDVNEIDCDKLTYSFEIDGNKFLMNVNAANIVNNKFYPEVGLNDEGFFSEDKVIYEYSGSYINLNDETIKFFFKVYEYDNNYILYFDSDEVVFYGYSSKDSSYLMAEKMLQMAKGLNVDDEKIIADFTSKDIIDYHKETVNLFENTMPIEGKVDDFMIGSNEPMSE